MASLRNDTGHSHGNGIGSRWGSRICALNISAMVALLAFAADAKGSEAPEVRLERTCTTFLTDTIWVTTAVDGKDKVLIFPKTQIKLPSEGHSSVDFSGDTVSVVVSTPKERAITLYDTAGKVVWKTSLPGDVAPRVFGRAVACFPVVEGPPGVPYSFKVASSQGQNSVERKGRVILGSEALSEYLVISSIEKGNPRSARETEVFDQAGKVQWKFTATDTTNPRVVVHENSAVALYPGRPSSTLAISNRGQGQAVSVAIKDVVANNVAFVLDQPMCLVWGSHDTALVDTGKQQVLWQTSLISPGEEPPVQLNTLTPYVSAVNGMVSTAVRERTTNNTWRVSLVFFDLRDGSIAKRQPLYETDVPHSFSRFKLGKKERVVFPHHVYQVGTREGGND